MLGDGTGEEFVLGNYVSIAAQFSRSFIEMSGESGTIDSICSRSHPWGLMTPILRNKVGRSCRKLFIKFSPDRRYLLIVVFFSHFLSFPSLYSTRPSGYAALLIGGERK